MLEDRRERLVAAVNERGLLPFSALRALFPDVSEMTLRKDLKCLDEQKRIVRIHGGARSLDTVRADDMPLSQRLCRNIELKKQIARKASSLVRSDMSVFLDTGSTTTELAKALPDIPCTVFTGGLSHINELARRKEISVHILGGLLNRDSLSVRDYALMMRQLEQLRFDICFITANSFSRIGGFCCRSSGRREMERAALRRCGRAVILMDSTKTGAPGTFTICMPEEIDTLVSDDNLDADTRQYLEEKGVRVL